MILKDKKTLVVKEKYLEKNFNLRIQKEKEKGFFFFLYPKMAWRGGGERNVFMCSLTNTIS